MPSQTPDVVLLCEMVDGQEGDAFVLMTAKESAMTRDKKPYWRVAFRDAQREVSFPVWNNSPWAEACRDQWQPGRFFKVRAVYRETSYGPQLEIGRIREVNDDDRQQGFDPWMCRPRSRFDSVEMFQQLTALVEQHVGDAVLRALVLDILITHREALLTLPAARRNHHAYVGGYLEHVLAVTQTGVWLAERYTEQYPAMDPPLSRDLVVAGAALHDIGKLRELNHTPQGAEYSPGGELLGHILQGRDLVREAAAAHDIDAETLLRLEHVIVAHQRLPEWGSPKPPMTPEALIVHYADDLDAKLQMMVAALAETDAEQAFSTPRNPMGRRIFRGLPAE